MTFWTSSDAESWHPGVDPARVTSAWQAAEHYVAARCRWRKFDPYTGAELPPPPDLQMAVKLLTARLLARHNSPDGLAAGGSDLGPVRVTSVDRDVMALIAPYKPVVFG